MPLECVLVKIIVNQNFNYLFRNLYNSTLVPIENEQQNRLIFSIVKTQISNHVEKVKSKKSTSQLTINDKAEIEPLQRYLYK